MGDVVFLQGTFCLLGTIATQEQQPFLSPDCSLDQHLPGKVPPTRTIDWYYPDVILPTLSFSFLRTYLALQHYRLAHDIDLRLSRYRRGGTRIKKKVGSVNTWKVRDCLS